MNFVSGLLGGDAGNSIPTSCSCTNGTEISPPFRSARFAIFSLFCHSIRYFCIFLTFLLIESSLLNILSIDTNAVEVNPKIVFGVILFCNK